MAAYARDRLPPRTRRNAHAPHFPRKQSVSRKHSKRSVVRYISTTDRSRTLPADSGREPEGYTSPVRLTNANPRPAVMPPCRGRPQPSASSRHTAASVQSSTARWSPPRRGNGASVVLTPNRPSSATRWSHFVAASARSGMMGSSTRARPAGTGKNTDHGTAPGSRTGSRIAGSSDAVSARTVVLIWSGWPASANSRARTNRSAGVLKLLTERMGPPPHSAGTPRGDIRSRVERTIA